MLKSDLGLGCKSKGQGAILYFIGINQFWYVWSHQDSQHYPGRRMVQDLIPGIWGTKMIKLLDDPMNSHSLANYPLKQLWSFDHFMAGFFATQFHRSSSIITHYLKSSYA